MSLVSECHGELRATQHLLDSLSGEGIHLLGSLVEQSEHGNTQACDQLTNWTDQTNRSADQDIKSQCSTASESINKTITI